MTQAGGIGSETVYQNLRQDILRLELAPGTELDEAAMAARYNVSRTPVREALIKLMAEGLVHATRGRGARVAPLDLRNLRAFLEGLNIFQRAVTRLAATRRRQSDLEIIETHMLAFEAGVRDFNSEKVNEINYTFHAAIGDASASSYLADAYRRCLVEGLRIGYVCFKDHSDIDERLETHLANTVNDHRLIFEAIAAGDADAAETHAGTHVELFRGRIVTTLLSTDSVRKLALDVG